MRSCNDVEVFDVLCVERNQLEFNLVLTQMLKRSICVRLEVSG